MVFSVWDPGVSDQIPEIPVGSWEDSCGRWGRIMVPLVVRPLGRSPSFNPRSLTCSPGLMWVALCPHWLARDRSAFSSLAWGIRRLSDVISEVTPKTFWLEKRIRTLDTWAVFFPSWYVGVLAVLEIAFSLVSSSQIMGYLWIPDCKCSRDCIIWRKQF